MNSREISKIITTQISSIEREDVRNQIKQILVEPFVERRDWDYAEEMSYECWVFAEPDQSSYFVYCSEGFGPSDPWGIVSKEPNGSIGPDFCWYAQLEDLFYQTGPFEGELPENYEVR